MSHFLRALLFGNTTVSRTPYFALDYDRCKWLGWDYYAFHLPFFRVIVSAKK